MPRPCGQAARPIPERSTAAMSNRVEGRSRMSDLPPHQRQIRHAHDPPTSHGLPAAMESRADRRHPGSCTGRQLRVRRRPSSPGGRRLGHGLRDRSRAVPVAGSRTPAGADRRDVRSRGVGGLASRGRRGVDPRRACGNPPLQGRKRAYGTRALVADDVPRGLPAPGLHEPRGVVGQEHRHVLQRVRLPRLRFRRERGRQPIRRRTPRRTARSGVRAGATTANRGAAVDSSGEPSRGSRTAYRLAAPSLVTAATGPQRARSRPHGSGGRTRRSR